MFTDRFDAGRQLAERLGHYAGRDDAIVLALPRGGVPVGYEVARALGAPLDVFLVRKLGTPGHEELAMGAIASGGVRVLNEGLVRQLGLTDRQVDVAAAEEQEELDRREHAYRDDRPPPAVRGKAVILVDDGLATGSTMRAAVQAVRRLGPTRVVVAAPVGAADTCERLGQVADEVVCALVPESFMAVGMWYEDFTQTTDDEVRDLLERATHAEVAGRSR
jgi:predicted phosphoribosyltransferase